ncbi:MAG: acylphosphatase [Chloroflexota bacterium]
MNPAIETVRAHIWVAGRVQGVGFRAFVQQTAMLIGVAGWVRNVGYNTVEALAEGERDKVDRFLQAMKRGPRMSLVEATREEWEAATGEFSSFEVRRSA